MSIDVILMVLGIMCLMVACYFYGKTIFEVKVITFIKQNTRKSDADIKELTVLNNLMTYLYPKLK